MYISAPKNSGFPTGAPRRPAISLAAPLLPPGSSHAATARPLDISRNRSPHTAVSMLPPCLSLRAPFTTTPQSGAPEYLLFLTEQTARPVIHAGLTGGGNSSMKWTTGAGWQERAQRLGNSGER